jgi:hypothetical protein
MSQQPFVHHGRGTLVREFRDHGPDGVVGRVECADGKPVTAGLVLVLFSAGCDGDGDDFARATLDERGQFTANGPDGWTEAMARYLPGPGLADSASRPLRRRR